MQMLATKDKDDPPMQPTELANSEKDEEIEMTPNMSLFTKFLKFAGPGFLISIACLDPGNLSGDIAIAQQTRFELYWVLVLAHVMAYVYQSISLTVGRYRSPSSDDKQ